jgi:uncharacterized membrane protein
VDGHRHAPDPPQRASPRTRVLLLAALVPLVLATIAGLVALWPENRTKSLPGDIGPTADLVNATVTSVTSAPCPAAQNICSHVRVRVTSGPDRGDRVQLPELILGADVPGLERGDRVVLGRTEDATGRAEYYFSDFQRRTPLVWLALIFAAAVVAVGRWRGLAALIGLAITWIVLLWFVLPAILDGESPVAVALVGSGVMMLFALYLTGGFNARTTTALLGTLASLALTGVLASLFVTAAHLTGLSSEEGVYLQTVAGRVDLSGVLLAGIVIGALGALNDVTVTQASAVWALHAVNPALRARELYGRAMRIGRDHIASTVDTLVLAYVGASLPLLIVFTLADRRVGDILTSEVVASEVVRTLVGSIGLVASVPLTTGLAAIVVASGGKRSVSARPFGRSLPRPSLRAIASRVGRPFRERAQRRRASWRPSRAEREFHDEPRGPTRS